MNGLFFTISYSLLLGRNDKSIQTSFNGTKEVDIDNDRQYQRRKSFSCAEQAISNNQASANNATSRSLKRRQSWCASTQPDENHSITREATQRRVSYNVSLFDGTDEDKWKQFGVYIGSDSDSADDSDSNCDLEVESFCKKILQNSNHADIESNNIESD
eukprot:CAMPEP_0197825678 /NCGR_PEP_ID=MMETSP1437-20131217/2721_1 /TAXON_ID=49252 ORGANISM="Eucampia antarctica, Strain CCMP1452" /NCGR_SAMPLE_ID=MMETSP1437 /ASSEMBLY_ACC=CAM_ASM_001096 /LENGTH=158 /DNA_ID=CAMNT_0043425783 /DNA_START=669 /DNA_END=1145 /DNA_ORIENTATION=-